MVQQQPRGKCLFLDGPLWIVFYYENWNYELRQLRNMEDGECSSFSFSCAFVSRNGIIYFLRRRVRGDGLFRYYLERVPLTASDFRCRDNRVTGHFIFRQCILFRAHIHHISLSDFLGPYKLAKIFCKSRVVTKNSVDIDR